MPDPRRMAPVPALRSRTTTIGIAAWLGFGALAVAVAQGWTQHLDEAVLVALRSGSAAFDGPLVAITQLGETWVRLALAAFGIAVLLLRRQRSDAMFLAVAALPAGLINSALKLALARPRPSVVEHLVPAGGLSFPSGHAFGGTVLYLSLALAFAPLVGAQYRRTLIASALLLGALIAFSRAWLGVHYPSDVLAGWLGAVGWVVGCRLVVERFNQYAKMPV